MQQFVNCEVKLATVQSRGNDISRPKNWQWSWPIFRVKFFFWQYKRGIKAQHWGVMEKTLA